MIGTFKGNIYVDPLTGLPNFFKFIELDANSIFGEKGSFIIFDIVRFTAINKKYGRDMGDFCIKALADSISKVLTAYQKTSAFRTDGDEFTIILPNMANSDAETISGLIRVNFKNTMVQEGLLDSEVNVHNLTLSYSAKIFSIDQFYQMVLMHSLDKEKHRDEHFMEEHWVGHIIGSFTHRIKETLSFFNHAYNLALTDDVSGLQNHRAAKTYLKALLEESKAKGREFSLLFIDGDNLKRYNKLSYETGNRMIKDLSEIISASLRESDVVFRWLSGDEFLVVLKNANYSNAIEVAERIRDEVQIQSSDWTIPVTVSIGVSNYPNDGNNIEELIDKCEKANSFAKDSGKNKVVKWDILNCG